MIDPSLQLMDAGQPAERPLRRDARENRERILETAERLFADRGVDAVTMAEIASQAGVGKGTLYRGFENKGVLCLALMDTQMRTFQDATMARLQLMGRAGEPALVRLQAFLRALATFTDRHAPLLCAAGREGSLDDTQLAHNAPYVWQYMTVMALLRQAVAGGEAADDLDLPYLADALLAPLAPDLFTFQRHGRGFSVERVADGIAQLVAQLGR